MKARETGVPAEAGPAFAGTPGLHVAFLLDDLTQGGVQRMTLALAESLQAEGYRVDLLLCRREGSLLDAVPHGVRVLRLARAGDLRSRVLLWRAAPRAAPLWAQRRLPWVLRRAPALRRYLRTECPDVLFAAKPWTNLAAICAVQGLAGRPRLVIGERTRLSERVRARPRLRALPGLVRALYPRADAIIAVSHGVAEDLDALLRGAARAQVVYNPAFRPQLLVESLQQSGEPWLGTPDRPVLLAVGALTRQKDYPTLLEAFALLRARQPARLVIAGEGKERKRLEALVVRLGLQDDVRLAGEVCHPAAWMARASVFVLASRYEGFGNVLVEALACGCRIVSTDCPSGPAEILAAGRYGWLVPVADPAALADALAEALQAPAPGSGHLERAREFSVRRAQQAYLAAAFAAPATVTRNA